MEFDCIVEFVVQCVVYCVVFVLVCGCDVWQMVFECIVGQIFGGSGLCLWCVVQIDCLFCDYVVLCDFGWCDCLVYVQFWCDDF